MKKQRHKDLQHNEKANNKMAIINPYIPIAILNIYELNS